MSRDDDEQFEAYLHGRHGGAIQVAAAPALRGRPKRHRIPDPFAAAALNDSEMLLMIGMGGPVPEWVKDRIEPAIRLLEHER